MTPERIVFEGCSRASNNNSGIAWEYIMCGGMCMMADGRFPASHVCLLVFCSTQIPAPFTLAHVGEFAISAFDFVYNSRNLLFFRMVLRFFKVQCGQSLLGYECGPNIVCPQCSLQFV